MDIVAKKMANTNIAVDDKNFICRSNWTVSQAKSEIRDTYQLTGGCLVDAGGAALLGTDLLSATIGAISFVGGQKPQGMLLNALTFCTVLVHRCPDNIAICK